MGSQRQVVYCETAFLAKFLENYPTDMPFPKKKAFSNYSSWINTYKYLCRSHVTLDCSAADFYDKAKDDEYLAELWKCSSDGEMDLDFEKNNFPVLNNESVSKFTDSILLSVFFTADNKEEIAKSLGIINISLSNYQDLQYLFVDNGKAIAKAEEGNWKFLNNKARHNCNTMIIVDNYILHNKEINLYRILDYLLPIHINTKFELMLITTLFGLDDTANTQSKSDIESDIEQWIHEIRPDLEIKLNLILVDKKTEFHDRFILTNNILICSVGGFDLFFKDKKGKIRSSKSTRVEIIYPYFQEFMQSAVDSYNDSLFDILDYLEDKKIKYGNRLLVNY